MRLGSGLSKLFAAIGSFFSFNKRGNVEMSALATRKKNATLTDRQARRLKARRETRTRYRGGSPNWLKIAIRSQR